MRRPHHFNFGMKTSSLFIRLAICINTIWNLIYLSLISSVPFLLFCLRRLRCFQAVESNRLKRQVKQFVCFIYFDADSNSCDWAKTGRILSFSAVRSSKEEIKVVGFNNVHWFSLLVCDFGILHFQKKFAILFKSATFSKRMNKNICG